MSITLNDLLLTSDQMRNPPLEEGRDQLVGILRFYANAPYADSSNETTRVRAVLLSTAADEIERLQAQLYDYTASC